MNSASHCWLLDVAMSSRMRLLGSNFSASIAILKETPIGRFLARGCSKTDEDFEMSGGGGLDLLNGFDPEGIDGAW